MILPLIFHELAEGELNDAIAYYAKARPGLGKAFLLEVQRATEALNESPLSGVPVDADLRRFLVKRFPYSIFYRVRSDHIRILAIAHDKRRPFYWLSRR